MSQGEPVEPTVQMILDLPPGQDWAWLPDCNIVALSSRLDAAGRERAISDLQATWRRSLLRSVPAAGECPDVA